MVTVHFDIIHVDNLVRSPAVEPFDLTGLAPPALVVAAAPGASEVLLQRHFLRPVWRAEAPEVPRLFDEKSSDERPGGKVCVNTFISRWSPETINTIGM